MTQLRTIEVDFDVHKCIENDRRSFAETPNDVLRRLLKLGPSSSPAETPSAPQLRPKGWVDKGVTLPHGTAVRMTYSGRVYHGKISDGLWVVENRVFESPSGAASGIALTKKGKTTRLDGWKYWQVRMPGSVEWIALDDLRPKEALAINGSPEELGL